MKKPLKTKPKTEVRSLRLPVLLINKLNKNAILNHRNLSGEIIARLEKSFDDTPQD